MRQTRHFADTAKATPELIGADEEHFTAVSAALASTLADLEGRLQTLRKAPGHKGQAALERDVEIHRLSRRLTAMRRFGVDLCLGRMVATSGESVYVGRLGLKDPAGRPLLIDWRSPAAEPFFGATHGTPMGLASRRRYRWSGDQVIDYWDEVFGAEALTADGSPAQAALDDQSAFIASLGAHRSARMRDVLGTIAADQDAVIRADAHEALVVDGGPGTGKTVVALHRAAYLLYSDPRIGHHRGRVLFIGPHAPYLAYVADVLPSLGEEGVQTCTLADLVPEGAAARPETDVHVASLKSAVQMAQAIEPAIGLYEEPPTEGMEVETSWSQVWLSAQDWADAFTAAEPGMPHNEARDEVWEALVDLLVDKHDQVDAPEDAVRDSLRRNEDLREAFDRSWPLINPVDLVADLWSVPAYLKRCAPWLERDDIFALQRPHPYAWTVEDLPLLDAARHRIGDPEAAARRHQRAAAQEASRAQVAAVIDDLIAADDDREGLVTMLRHPDIRSNLVDDSAAPQADPDLLAGPFAHVIVDEAQELSDAQWQMLIRRCPSRSFTIVGDRAQARHGFPQSWEERLARVGLDRVTRAKLRINYRTPQEVMDAAEPVIRAAIPDANVPISVRSNGIAVREAHVSERDVILREWLSTHPEGTACVIGDARFAQTERVQSLSPALAKGLEFDLVVLHDPKAFGEGVQGAVDRYVAMTRATSELVIVVPDRAVSSST